MLDSKGRKKIFTLITGIVLLFLLLVIMITPYARIDVELTEKIFKQSYTFTFDDTIEEPIPALGLLPNGDDTHVRSFLKDTIELELSADEKIKEDSLTYSLRLLSNGNQGTLFGEVIIVSAIDVNTFKDEIHGKNKNNAVRYLESQPEVESVSLTTTPRALFFIPFIKERIFIHAL